MKKSHFTPDNDRRDPLAKISLESDAFASVFLDKNIPLSGVQRVGIFLISFVILLGSLLFLTDGISSARHGYLFGLLMAIAAVFTTALSVWGIVRVLLSSKQ